MSELDLQKYVVGLLVYYARQDVLWTAIPNGEARSPITGAKLRAMGVRRGAADLLIVVKGRTHFLELKWGKGRQSSDQMVFAAWAEAAGGVYEVARTPEQAKAILSSWGALRPDSVGDIVRHIQGAA